MTKALQILMILLFGLTAGVGLGLTGVAPANPVAPAVEAAQEVAPAPPAWTAEPGEPTGGGETVTVESGGSYLGVDVQDVSKERMSALKLKEESGVEINMVDRDAPAGKAGLKEHDVILEFNGTKLESVEQLRRMIREMPPGRTVTLGISRDGQPMTLKATLAARNKTYSYSYSGPKPPKPPKVVIPKIEMPEMRAFEISVMGPSRSGLLVENLTPQLGDFFGVKDGAGVLVRSVEKGSPAEAAGFKAGDVIIRVEQEKVADRGDWRSSMRSHSTGKVSVGIIRDRKEQTLSLALPESKDQSSVWRLLGPEGDLDELKLELDDLDFQIDRLEPQMEKMRPEMERMKKDMELRRKELSAQLTASLAQSRDEMRKAMAEVRAQRDTVRQARQETVQAVRTARQSQLEAWRAARRDAQRAWQAQIKELEKARQKMLQKMEMY